MQATCKDIKEEKEKLSLKNLTLTPKTTHRFSPSMMTTSSTMQATTNKLVQ
jgi:hypothetical protein